MKEPPSTDVKEGIAHCTSLKSAGTYLEFVLILVSQVHYVMGFVGVLRQDISKCHVKGSRVEGSLK